MQYYVVTYTHTKIFGWAVYLLAHIKYLKKLVAQGKLQISGPGVGTPVRSAQLVFKVTDREELDKLIADDPYSVHGLIASSTVNLWNVKWGSMEKQEVPDPEGTKYFRAVYELPAGVHLEESASRHDEYVDGLLKNKKLRAAGPYVNNNSAGLAILSVPDAATADSIMQEDPYVEELGANYQVIQWDPKFGEF